MIVPRNRARAAVSAIVVAGLVLTGCGDDGGEDAPPEEAAAQQEPSPRGEASPRGLEEDAPTNTAGTAGYDEVFAAAEHMEVWALEVVAGIDEFTGIPGDPHAEAARVLATWDGLWRADVVFSAYAADAEITGSQEAFLAAQDTMGRVREELAREWMHLFDEEIAKQFEELYTDYQLATIRYAQAVSTDDEAAKQKAAEDLKKFREDYVDFVVDTTADQVRRDELSTKLEETITKLTDTIDAQREGGTDWFRELEPAVDSTKHVAELVAEGIAKQLTLRGDVTSEAATYRAEMSGRMAETAWFLGFVTRATVNPEPEGQQAQHARRLVDENTAELRESWAKHLGEDTALTLADAWTHHVDLLVAYAEAVARDDADARNRLEDELATWAEELATTLDEATNGALTKDAMKREADKHYRTVIDATVAQHEFLVQAPA